jgi:molybdenum cofactor cytidylyltransferase
LPGPTVLILASGRGERFRASGGAVHKLQALLAGKPVLLHTLDAVRASGLSYHLEDAGHPGMGDAIAAAVRATADSDGWLVLPGDLPLIAPATLLAVAQALASHTVVVPACQGRRGHPVGFGTTCRDALLALRGDQGAAAVVRAHGAHQLVVTDVGSTTDIDTLQDLQAAERLLGQRADQAAKS